MTDAGGNAHEAGADWSAFIGASQQAEDLLTPRLAAEFAAALGGEVSLGGHGAPAPLCIHFALAPAIVEADETGADGHPRRGDFLPPIALPRRMWAGGEIRFVDPLRIGDRVVRTSTIRSVTQKSGRSGPLVFVAVEHVFETERGIAVAERQDNVYRAPAGPGGASAPADPPAMPTPHRTITRAATPLLLFRFSAVTFNGHRIHYDRPYAREQEGYDGLVVHGPLQAALMASLAQENLRDSFTIAYRGVRPLIDGASFSVNAARTDAGLLVWVADAGGTVTMRGEATGRTT